MALDWSCPKFTPHDAHPVKVVYRWRCSGVVVEFAGLRVSDCGKTVLHLPHYVDSAIKVDCEGVSG